MELHFAKRMESFQPGIFNVLNDKKNELLKAGRTVYNPVYYTHLDVYKRQFQMGVRLFSFLLHRL